MNIMYDSIIFSLQRMGGISVYWSNLKHYLGDRITKDIVFEDARFNYAFTNRLSSASSSTFSDRRAFERFLPIRENLENNVRDPFIFHSSYYRWNSCKNSINVTTVHDFTYERYRKDLKSIAHKIQKKRAVYNSKGVICISNNTLKDFNEYYPDYVGETSVIYNGFSEDYNVLSTSRKVEKIVLFVGNRSKYKNFEKTVLAMNRLKEYSLAVVGGGELLPEEKKLLERHASGKYSVLGNLGNTQLNELFNKSFCLVYPSDYEGFGIPPLEAMAAGCPVVCQMVSSLPEVCGDAGVYISSAIPEEIARGVRSLENPCFRNEKVTNGVRRAGLFSWEITAQKTLEFYELLLRRWT